MAGHSKWKNIQHRKGAQDAKRGKIFTKIGKLLTIAAKEGGGDPDSNAKLRLVLSKAKAANMPKDNIERAIKKGTGESDGTTYTEKVYEGYGPGGVAILVECLTDNVNRTVGEVRHAFTRSGGNLGTDGSVAWMFHNKGLIVYEKDKVDDYDKLLEVAIENGAEDVTDEAGAYEIICEPAAFSGLQAAMENLGWETAACELTRIPENLTEIDSEKVASIQKLVDVLEDNDDIQNVYHNAQIPDQ